MRRALDALYDGAAWLARAVHGGDCCMMVPAMSVTSRQLHFHLPGTDAYAGYLMAASGFLALAHTLKRGEHIRVTLLLGMLHDRARRGMELWALAAASALSLLSAGYAARLVWQSQRFNDISTGNDATPLWIPQLAMALGTAVILAVAFMDELWLECQRPARATGQHRAASQRILTRQHWRSTRCPQPHERHRDHGAADRRAVPHPGQRRLDRPRR